MSIKMEIIENHIISYFLVSVDTLFVGVAGFEPAASCSQSRRDNRATLHPVQYKISKYKCPPLPKLWRAKAERQGFEPWRHLRVDRLAICSVTTPAPLLFL